MKGIMMKYLKTVLIGLCLGLASSAHAGILHAIFTTSFTLVGATLGRVAGSSAGPKIAKIVEKQAPKSLKKLLTDKPKNLKYSVITASEFTGMFLGGVTFYHGAREK